MRKSRLWGDKSGRAVVDGASGTLALERDTEGLLKLRSRLIIRVRIPYTLCRLDVGQAKGVQNEGEKDTVWWTAGPPYTLYFGIKFYAEDPCKLKEEITRYQFFLQVKQDALQGRLPCPVNIAAQLGAYAIQAELGDHDPYKHTAGYVSEYRFVPDQKEELEEAIERIHKTLMSCWRDPPLASGAFSSLPGVVPAPVASNAQLLVLWGSYELKRLCFYSGCRGQAPSEAELNYLRTAKSLEMYGVDLHPVYGENKSEYFLGLTPVGVVVYKNKKQVGKYFWPRITKVHFKETQFELRVLGKDCNETSFFFEARSKTACKHLWKCSVEHHTFFSGLYNSPSDRTKSPKFPCTHQRNLSCGSDKESAQHMRRRKAHNSGEDSDLKQRRRSRSRCNTSSGSESENSNREHRKKRNRIRQENDMVDSAPQWEAVLRRQKEKTQVDPNNRRSRHRSRSKELVDPSGLSEEQLKEIPYTKVETQGDPVRIRHSHSPRSYRQYRRSQCSDGERSVLSEVNSKTDLVPPLPVTRSSDAQGSGGSTVHQPSYLEPPLRSRVSFRKCRSVSNTYLPNG
ncbi:Band 4.1-like protein 4A [Microtus ochrogaster]|uniref:Band 4.1-like protein 4A n=1 Tax=Microtus ochrogaster TaxID=79684 RepID=A0A8J6G908_MICOH|nr:Band 4.1-like protein 4A [Microtus ochrogaster]